MENLHGKCFYFVTRLRRYLRKYILERVIYNTYHLVYIIYLIRRCIYQVVGNL